MIDIENKGYVPNIPETIELIGNPLFDELYAYMNSEYSGDKILLGWNVKFKKAGRTLCTIYPRKGFFHMLLVVGRKEKDRTEALMPTLSDEFRKVYSDTKEGMGQRWLLFDLYSHTVLYDDILKIIAIRRQSK